ncbi:MAG: four helix bundle protein [Bacteroidota bacterium]
MAYAGYRDLHVYQLAFNAAMEIFHASKSFPPEERFSLTDQARRSSRSVAANLAEAWRKRRYPKLFVSKLTECAAEASETEVWLEMALACGYISNSQHEHLMKADARIHGMLHSMIQQPEKFTG